MPVLAVTKTFALVYMVSMSLIACFRSSDLPAEVLNDISRSMSQVTEHVYTISADRF